MLTIAQKQLIYDQHLAWKNISRISTLVGPEKIQDKNIGRFKDIFSSELTTWPLYFYASLSSKTENSMFDRRSRKSERVHWFVIVGVVSSETSRESGLLEFRLLPQYTCQLWLEPIDLFIRTVFFVRLKTDVDILKLYNFQTFGNAKDVKILHDYYQSFDLETYWPRDRRGGSCLMIIDLT